MLTRQQPDSVQKFRTRQDFTWLSHITVERWASAMCRWTGGSEATSLRESSRVEHNRHAGSDRPQAFRESYQTANQARRQLQHVTCQSSVSQQR